jgi:aspartyl-tRNA(Asn)/glutamyl-tRNA(Gln) amidotransferase subunit B
MANFYEAVVARDGNGLCNLAATWIADTLAGELNYRGMGIDAVDVKKFAGLLVLLKAGTITDKSGVEVLRVILDELLKGEIAETPEAIVARLNLAKTSGDDAALMSAIHDVITENQKAIEDYRAGKNGALNFLVGQTMKKTRGRADPGELNRLMVESLKSVEQ